MPHPFWPKPIDMEGFLLEIDKEGGIFLVCYLPRLTKQEEEFLKQPIEVRCLIPSEGLITTMIRFGESPILAQLDYDPSKGPEQTQAFLNSLNSGGLPLVKMFALDPALEGQIRVIRGITLPPELKDAWRKHWHIALSDLELTSLAYPKMISRFNSVDIFPLWEGATPMGVFGR